MNDDDVAFDSIEGSDDDQLDPRSANNNEDAIFSGGDPDDKELSEEE